MTGDVRGNDVGVWFRWVEGAAQDCAASENRFDYEGTVMLYFRDNCVNILGNMALSRTPSLQVLPTALNLVTSHSLTVTAGVS
jgi:hypothetical protein